ncbi:MAG: UDP-N-acetylmuramate dehydrogenase [Candidatus Omnitrophica bacterium]|nr:UDP-N-acetylmuramate dehydrogenase [Candidatus Omnitrophota bacterium]
MYWPKRLKKRLRFREPLARHTTLNVGGPAAVWIEPHDVEELGLTLSHCVKNRLPYMIIGKGSNLLVGDQGFKGAMLSLNAGIFAKMEFRGNHIRCGAGVALSRLLRECQRRGLGGLEFLAGVPATVAGALIMNAGSKDKYIGRYVESVTVMDEKERVRTLNKDRLKFGYRRSNLSKFVVLEATLKLIKKDPQKIKKESLYFLERKKKTQDLSFRSAGCIFKNPQHRLSAAAMIDACGLKSRRRGGAEISTKHANYIINRSGATAEDLLYLIKLAQKQVKNKFGVKLEPEVKIVR